jgi:integrating conjugative element protein (TIGR03765 family)
MNTSCPGLLTLLLLAVIPQTTTQAEERALIVVDDLGGASALPYYRALNLQPRDVHSSLPDSAQRLPQLLRARYSEADLLPVRSARLTPGPVAARTLDMPGLTPLFLVGDDNRSRAWLRERIEELRTLRAFGFVVNVDSAEALASLRNLAPGLTLTPASGDDFGQRLALRHYPVLITATGIEQ